jgi:amino acid adenylation domain-containing protein
MTICEMFEGQVRRSPDAVAVAGRHGQMTYRELDERSNSLARHLGGLGVGLGTRVAVCVGRVPEVVVALLGILKSGGAYIPLDEAHPRLRLEFMLADAGVDVVVTRRSLQSSLPDFSGRVVCMDADWPQTPARPLPAPASQPTPDDLAYVIYTSGTTGQPKGVMCTHRGVTRLVKGASYISLSASTRFLQLSPLTFDAHLIELWGPVLSGGTVVMSPAEPRYLLDFMRDAVSKYGITTISLISSQFNLLMEEDPLALKPLSEILVGGEVVSPAHVKLAARLIPDTRIVACYGPTENALFSSVLELGQKSSLMSLRSIPLGRAIPDTTQYVLDEFLDVAPIGVVGEICVGGAGLAIGYLGRPGLTASCFVPDPFSAEPGARLFRSGDLGRRLPNGEVEFIGRADGQVKLRGFRIELGEVETVLAEYPGVAQCVAIVREIARGDRRLVAYVTGWGKSQIPVASLLAYAEERLPEYMVPSVIMPLDRIPTTMNGKVDRAALPAPAGRHDRGRGARASRPRRAQG